MMSIQSVFRPDLLAGKVALVTGGASGIGLEISTQLGKHGACVVVAGRRQQVLDGAVELLTAAGIRCAGIQCDVRRTEDCEDAVASTVSRYGRLDILVNAAAGNFLATAEELSVNGFKTVMDIDAVGTFAMSHAAFPHLRQSGDAAIINISANLHYGATWWQAHASAAKAAVDSVTRSLGLEWGCFGIRVNGVAPGPTAGTPGMEKLGPAAAEATEAAVKAALPLGRMGSKWDIAQGCVFLASPAAASVTGTVLVMDCGEWLARPPLIPRAAVSKVSRSREKRPAGPPASKL